MEGCEHADLPEAAFMEPEAVSPGGALLQAILLGDVRSIQRADVRLTDTLGVASDDGAWQNALSSSSASPLQQVLVTVLRVGPNFEAKQLEHALGTAAAAGRTVNASILQEKLERVCPDPELRNSYVAALSQAIRAKHLDTARVISGWLHPQYIEDAVDAAVAGPEGAEWRDKLIRR